MPKFKPLPAVETLREHLHYDPATGEFTWLKAVRNNVKSGSRAGRTNEKGYRLVAFHRSQFYAHRLAWLMHHGIDPGEMEIDHINGDKSDNRIDNLRLATRGQNMLNAKTRADSTSGVKGVCWGKQQQKWQAQLCLGGKRHYLGVFPTIEEAEAAIRAARGALHGEFSHHG